MTAKNTFSKNLRNIRKSKRVSQETLAELINCSNHVISNLERGITSPNLDTMELICEAFEIHISELILDSEIEIGQRNQNFTALSREANKLSDENLVNVIEIMQVLNRNQQN